MSERKYFKEALASMVSHAAYTDAVRHMHDAGLSVQEICQTIDFPVSAAKVEETIRAYEAEKNSPASGYEYVQTIDSYGRKSFIRRPVETPASTDGEP